MWQRVSLCGHISYAEHITFPIRTKTTAKPNVHDETGIIHFVEATKSVSESQIHPYEQKIFQWKFFSLREKSQNNTVTNGIIHCDFFVGCHLMNVGQYNVIKKIHILSSRLNFVLLKIANTMVPVDTKCTRVGTMLNEMMFPI